MPAVKKMQFNRKNLEFVAKTMDTDIETVFKKLPEMMGWDDDKVLSLLGYELGG